MEGKVRPLQYSDLKDFVTPFVARKPDGRIVAVAQQTGLEGFKRFLDLFEEQAKTRCDFQESYRFHVKERHFILHALGEGVEWFNQDQYCEHTRRFVTVVLSELFHLAETKPETAHKLFLEALAKEVAEIAREMNPFHGGPTRI